MIAGNDAHRADGVTPPAAAWTAVIAGVASFSGWALSMWFGIAPANLLWVAASILMSAWTIWFGVALAREPTVSMENAEAR